METSPQPPAFWRWTSYILLIPVMGLVVAFFGSIALIVGLWDKSGKQQHAVARVWGAAMLKVALSPVTVTGVERIADLPTAVYACNHLSYMDTPVIFAKMPRQFRIMAKSTLWKIPFIGWYLNRSGQLPIDQESARGGIASLVKGAKQVESGMPLFVFPEGGRTPDGNPQPYLAGASFVAIRAQVPIVPITLVGTRELLPIHVYALYPRPLKLIIGEPIPTTGMNVKQADELTERVKQVITETYMREHSAA